MERIETLVEEAMEDAGDPAAVLELARRDGVTDVASAALVREEEWAAYGMPKIRARALVATLQRERSRGATTSGGGAGPGALLPEVPDDASLLAALRVGGVAKVEATDVVAAIRVAFADKLGVFDAEERILSAIEQRARELDEPCPPILYDLQKSLVRKAHADVLAAMEVPGTFVTERRKRELLARTDRLWDALADFQQQLASWQETWQERVTNPGTLLAGIAAMVSGGQSGGAAPLPATSMMEAPDTGPVLDASKSVIDAVNRVFAGTGIPVARALAADAVELRELLERDDLPAAIGAGSREEMLKSIGLGVSAALVRADNAVAQYVLTVLGLDDVDTKRLPMVIVALKELGASIPWDELRKAPSGASARKVFGG